MANTTSFYLSFRKYLTSSDGKKFETPHNIALCLQTPKQTTIGQVYLDQKGAINIEKI